MSDPMRALKCMLKRFRTHYSEASVHNWSFPSQEMQCGVRVVIEAYQEREIGGTRRALGFILMVLRWRRIRRHSRLRRCHHRSPRHT